MAWVCAQCDQHWIIIDPFFSRLHLFAKHTKGGERQERLSTRIASFLDKSDEMELSGKVCLENFGHACGDTCLTIKSRPNNCIA